MLWIGLIIIYGTMFFLQSHFYANMYADQRAERYEKKLNMYFDWWKKDIESMGKFLEKSSDPDKELTEEEKEQYVYWRQRVQMFEHKAKRLSKAVILIIQAKVSPWRAFRIRDKEIKAGHYIDLNEQLFSKFRRGNDDDR